MEAPAWEERVGAARGSARVSRNIVGGLSEGTSLETAHGHTRVSRRQRRLPYMPLRTVKDGGRRHAPSRRRGRRADSIRLTTSVKFVRRRGRDDGAYPSDY